MTSKDETLLHAKQLLETKQFEQALAVIDSYLTQHGSDPTIQALGSKIHLTQNQIPQALAYFQLAFDGGLSDEEALGKYSATLYERREFETATRVLQRLTEVCSDRAVYFSNLGYVRHLMGDDTAAEKHCSRAIELDANCIEAYCNLGMVLLSQKKTDEAVDAFNRGIARNAHFAKLHTGLGMVHQQCNRFTQAIAAHQQAIMLDPACIEAYCNLGIAQMQCLHADWAVGNFRQALRLNPHYSIAISNLQLGLQYLPGIALSQLRQAATYPADGSVGREQVKKKFDGGARNLRIGFVSADFYKHPVGYFLRGLFQIPRTKGYEFYCYANQGKSDSFTEALRGSADSWLDVRALSDQKLAETIRGDGIDVLVDLSGHTAGNRLGAFARRPAPVQVSWLGYFASTNTNFMDYMLLSRDQAPPGAESYYSEKLVRLDCCQFAYFPPEQEVAIRDRPGSAAAAERNGVVFGSFNNVAKINDEVIAAWAQILNAVPASSLVLKWKSFEDQTVCENTLARFQRLGVEREQLQLRGASPHEEMLDQYNDIDIALDTFPFSGALTSCEALWMGVPVVTLRQLRPVSRQTHAILKSIDLECLSSRTPAEYIETAVKLASDAEHYAETSGGLRERLLKSSATDQAVLSEELERFFRDVSDQ